jgi:hypothetical protein
MNPTNPYWELARLVSENPDVGRHRDAILATTDVPVPWWRENALVITRIRRMTRKEAGK